MEMPKWNDLFLSALEAYVDGASRNNKEVCKQVADGLGLPVELREEKNPQVGDNKIENRVGWAISALKIAGLLEMATRGYNKLTEAGRHLLSTRNGEGFNEQFLINSYPSYRENRDRNLKRAKNRKPNNTASIDEMIDSTPEDLLQAAASRLQSSLQEELLGYLRGMDVYQFEDVVADLLKAMGYGDLGEVKVTKKSNDEGVDAIVNEDALGLSKIFAQAKRYAANNIVQKKVISDFVGALGMKNVDKGVFVTTSDFYSEAEADIKATGKSIILINGDRLTELMIENNVGVSVAYKYEVKKVDTDYFDQ
jgi:restriction system protein